MAEIIFIHRNRNPKSDYLGGLLTPRSFVFDYRGKSSLTMLWSAFRASFILPSAKVYLVEGALCLWPVFFRKLWHPNMRIIMMVPEPAFNWRVRSWVKNLILRFVFNSVDYFLPISNLVASDLQYYSHKPFSIVHHFSELDMNSLVAITPNYDATKILFAINRPQETGWTKGLDYVLAITKMFAAQNSSWKIYLIGEGTENLSGEWSELVSQGCVHLEGYQDPSQYYAFCPFLLVPARYDAFSLATSEACAAGCIPLVSPTTGAEELVRKADPTLVIDYHNPQDYVNKIIALHRLGHVAMGTLGLKLRAEAERYTPEASISELEKAVIKINNTLHLDLQLKSH